MPKNDKNIDMERFFDKRNEEAMENLKKIPGQLVDAVGGMFGTEQAPPAVRPDMNNKAKKQMGSYFGAGNEPMLGEVDSGGMSTEEVQKMQNAQREKEKLQEYLQMQKQLQEPPMEVPSSRAIDLDPRLANPENFKRFQQMREKIKKEKQ